jgi:hypothetical protein
MEKKKHTHSLVVVVLAAVEIEWAGQVRGQWNLEL